MFNILSNLASFFHLNCFQIALLLAIICIICAIGTTIWEELVGKVFIPCDIVCLVHLPSSPSRIGSDSRAFGAGGYAVDLWTDLC